MLQRATTAISLASVLLATFLLGSPGGAAAEVPTGALVLDGGRLVRQGAPATTAPRPGAKVYERIEMGFVTRWMTSYDGQNATLDDDLVGEDSLSPVCSSQKLSDAATAPRVYTTDAAYSDGRIFSNQYDVPASNTDVIRYYQTQVESVVAREATMLVGADDGIRVWVNGTEVLRQDAPAEYQEGSMSVAVMLEEGWNQLVVKVYYPQLGPAGDPDHEAKFWSLRFTNTTTGDPLTDLYQSVDGWCAPEDGLYGWVYGQGAADVSGARGSQWLSELRVTNPYPHPLRAEVLFFALGNSSGVPDGSEVLRLQPFESHVFDNLVQELTGVDEFGSGSIAIGGLYYWDMAAYDAARLVTANVGDADGGRFGTQIPLGWMYDGTLCCSRQVYGLRNGADDRTNLLLTPTPPNGEPVEVTVYLWDPVSGRTGETTFTASGPTQVNNLFNRAGLGDVTTDQGIAHLSWSGANSYLRIDASVNDNVTSDPTMVVRAPYGIPTPFQ